MGFRNIEIKDTYNSLNDSVVEEFFIPVLKESVKYERAVGFFSSSALIDISRGICGLIKNGGMIDLITSPILSAEDIEQMTKGFELRNEIIEKSLLNNIWMPEEDIEKDRLNLMANLIAIGKLNIRIAIVTNHNNIGLFHIKTGIVYDSEGNKIAFTGSTNDSHAAYNFNFDNIETFQSWNHDEGRVNRKKEDFKALWNGEMQGVEILDFPVAAKEKLLKCRTGDKIDTDLDEREYGRKVENITKGFYPHIPAGITERSYQIEAIDKWQKQGFRGIFDMATGTGKTYTALMGISRLASVVNYNLMVIVVCPYQHLVDQWAEDIISWGMKPIIAYSGSQDRNWKDRLFKGYKRYRRLGKSFVCVTTNATYKSKDFQQIIQNIDESVNALLIADEAHNFGAENMRKQLNESIKYRLGLSATIERFGDEEGTQALYTYFGEKCISYPLERAIREGALVEYEYIPVPVSLNDEELQRYYDLSRQLVKYIDIKNDKQKISEKGEKLLYERSRLVAGAREKIEKLEEVIEPHKKEKYMLVYCGATKGYKDEDESDNDNKRQIEEVEDLLGNRMNIVNHKYTSQESAKERREIKKGFALGWYQVLTAIKCLDEGVNIPEIRTAFILASSRNPKEFIQRRGRLLRKAEGKTRALIYDFVTLPRPLENVHIEDFERDKSLVLGELRRVNEFGKYSINRRVADEFIENVKYAYGEENFYEFEMEEE